VLFFTEDACSLYERDPRGHSLSILLIFLPKELYKKEFLISGPNNNQGKKIPFMSPAQRISTSEGNGFTV
jgi:hypothetical protein